jgi:ketosteroid isomerase-like protein
MLVLDDNKALVRSFFDALSAGRFDDAELMVDGTGDWSIPRRREVNRISGQIRLIRTEGMSFEVGVLTAEDDRVSALVHGAMRRPSGEPLAKSYHFLIRISGARIVDVCMYDDGGLAALGHDAPVPK